jgi:hypothetical protein
MPTVSRDKQGMPTPPTAPTTPVVLGIQGYTIIYVSEAMLLPITIQLPPIAGKENFDCIHPYNWIMYWGCVTYTTDP